DDNFVVRIIQLHQMVEALANRARSVVRTNDDGDPGPCEGGSEGCGCISITHGCQGRLWFPLSRCEAKVPVVDIAFSSIPLIRPGKHERTGASGMKRGANLPGQRSSLGLLPISKAVHAHLGDQERTVSGKILQSGYVCLKWLSRFQVN